MLTKALVRSRPLLVHGMIIALFIPVLDLGLVRWCAWKIDRFVSHKIATVNDRAWLVREGQGYNPANIYWVVRYDCRETDVSIAGVIPRCLYWSIVPYDARTLPLPSYLYDETVRKEEGDKYTAYLTTRPTGRANEIDVSCCSCGLAIIRMSFPEDAKAAAELTPEVKAVPRP